MSIHRCLMFKIILICCQRRSKSKTSDLRASSTMFYEQCFSCNKFVENYNIHIMFSCFHLFEVISCENVTLGKWKQIMQCVSLYVYEIHNLFIFDCRLYIAIIYLSYIYPNCITTKQNGL